MADDGWNKDVGLQVELGDLVMDGEEAMQAELEDLRATVDWQRSELQRERKENEAHQERHLQADLEHTQRELEMQKLRAKINTLELLHPDAARTMELTELRVRGETAAQMKRLKERHESEMAALRDANTAIKSAAEQLYLAAEANSKEDAQDGGDVPKSSRSTLSSARDAENRLAFLRVMDREFSEQEVILASAVGILRVARKAQESSSGSGQAGLWF